MTIFGISVDEFVKLASMVGAIIVGAGAVIAYYDKGMREQKKPFREAQLALCREASEAAATLASLMPRPGPPTDQGVDAWHEARARFEELYWGSLAVVEDENLEARMVAFRAQFIACENEIIAGTLEEDKRESLQQHALAIAHASRALIAQGWRLVLPEPTAKAKASKLRQVEFANQKKASKAS